MKKLAVVTGANRGLGLGTAQALVEKGYSVIVTARNLEKGKAAAEKIGAQFEPLDLSDPAQIEKGCAALLKHGVPDVLVNNAGIFPGFQTGLEVKLSDVQRALQTNTFGPLLVCQQILPHMIKKGFGRIVNVSSGMGQLHYMAQDAAAYRISKTALNAVTRILASQTQGTNVLINSVCPGWVKTDMGGATAPRELQQGVDSIVWAALLPDDGPNGLFFRDGKQIEW